MSKILTIGYTTEGSTDVRFLGNIIQRTFEELIFESQSYNSVAPPANLTCTAKKFSQKILKLATLYSSLDVICVHCDADGRSSKKVMNNKINPAFQLVENSDKGKMCKNLVAVIPVQMTEAWMLADFDLLKDEIGTRMSNRELELPVRINQIESLSNPKEKIINALRIAQASKPRRRRKIKISELYTPLSQKLSIKELRELPSFRAFEENAREALKRLNYLY